jgi:hypothetical protein
MTPTEPIATTASTPKAGLFVTLGGLLRAKGTRTPKTTLGKASRASNSNPTETQAQQRTAAGKLTTLGVATNQISVATFKQHLILVFAFVLASLAFAATPAIAKEIHIYRSSFGSEGTGPGQFKEPAGVAVNDETGDVYVADKGNNRIEQFSSAGAFIAEFDGSAAPTGALEKPTWVAVDNCTNAITRLPCSKLTEDPSVGDVYVTGEVEGGAHRVIYKFEADGAYLGQITTGEGGAAFSELEGVAVDPAGELWVYQSTNEVDNYTDAVVNVFHESHKLEPFGAPVGAAPGFVVGPGAGSEDEVYASIQFVGSVDDDFRRFNSAGQWLGDPQSGIEPWGGGEHIAGAIDLPNNELYIDYGTAVGAFDAPNGPEIESFGSKDLTASTGIGVNSSPPGSPLSNEVYVSDGAADRVVVFGPVKLPTTTTEAATGVDKTGATLHGTVNPEETVDRAQTEVKSCEFEYRTAAESSYYKTLACEPTTPYTGNAAIAVSAHLPAPLTAVAAGTTIYYRLNAANSSGAEQGLEESVVIPPTVDALSTGPAEKETPNTAKLTGTLSPDGVEVTSCEFEYGTSTFYGRSVPCEQAIGTGNAPVAVTATPTGLAASTTYHFRLVGVNSFGTTYGEDATFTTPLAVEAVSTGPAEAVTGNTAKLTGSLAPDGTDAHYYFEYGTEPGIYSATAPVPPGSDAGNGGAECLPPGGVKCSPVAAATIVTGLIGNTTYHYRLVAVNAFGTTPGSEQTLTTLSTAVIAAGEAKEVTGSGAELRATVNPEGLPVTRCRFEYGTSTAYGTAVPCEQKLTQIGFGTEPVPVSARIAGLSPNATYYWRLSVEDPNGEAHEPGHTFIYPTTTTTPELPDHRAYEMVTPPFKDGALVGDTFGGFKYSNSEDGSRVLAISIQCFDAEETCTGSRGPEGEPFEFTRTSSGWVTTALAPPQQLKENSAWLAGADAGTALFSAPTGPGSEDEWWARAAGGAFAPVGPATPPGITGIESFGNGLKESTADLSHIVWEAGEHSREYFWPFDKTTRIGAEPRSLYEYAGTDNKEPFLVGVSGETSKHELISTCGTLLGSSVSIRGALSADGRTVYFTANPKTEQSGQKVACLGSGVNAHTPVPVKELYARVDGESTAAAGQSAAARTAAISEPRAPQVPAGPHPECESEECRKNTESPAPPATNPSWREATFDGASSDGSRVFFASEQQLTDRASEDSMNLYESECEGCAGLDEAEELAKRRLIDVSEGVGGAPVPGGPRVQGFPVAISGDGSHVYFVARGVLTGEERPGCMAEWDAAGRTSEAPCHAVDGADNLYVFANGRTSFVASLSAANCASGGDCKQWRESTYANVTPDGRFLVFASTAALTPDDTRTAEPPFDGKQIFRYDAGTGELVRISVGDEGYDDDGNAGTGSAVIVTANKGYVLQPGFPRGDPTMSDDGSYVFFMSPVALTPHALNDVVIGEQVPSGSVLPAPLYAQNVYEWHEGHVYLISDGHDTSGAKTPCPAEEERTYGSASCLLGSDASGHNVFFETADQLVGKDTDSQVDIYDARICEPEHGNPCITEPPPALPPCGGEQCHGIPEPTPSLLAPGTATFNGEGNVSSPPPAVVKPKSLTKAQKLANALRTCRKDKKKTKRKSCEASAQKKYGAAKKAKKASHNGRGK